MIDDLKADSARWEQERRQQSARSNTAGGIIATRDANGVYVRPSNSPTVQYRNSETHSSRQYYGPTEAGQPGYSENYSDGPRYPGTGSPGYTGAANPSYYSQQAPPQGGFAPQQQGYSNQPPQYQTAQQGGSIPYPGHQPTGMPSQEPPYIAGANFGAAGDRFGSGDQFSASRDLRDPRDPRDPRVAVSTMAPSRTVYATAGSSAPPSVYPPSGSGGYYAQGTQPPTQQQFPQMPQDPLFGRGAYISGRR